MLSLHTVEYIKPLRSALWVRPSALGFLELFASGMRTKLERFYTFPHIIKIAR